MSVWLECRSTKELGLSDMSTVKCMSGSCRHTCPALLPVFAQPHFEFHITLQLSNFTSQYSSYSSVFQTSRIVVSQPFPSIVHPFFPLATQSSLAMPPTAYDTWLVGLREDNESMPGVGEQQAFLDFLNQRKTAREAALAYTHVVTNAKYQDPDALWYLVWQAAQDRPETHECLVELLKAISCLPPFTREGKVGEDSGSDYWSGLPEFEFGLREYWDGKANWDTTSVKDASDHTV